MLRWLSIRYRNASCIFNISCVSTDIAFVTMRKQILQDINYGRLIFVCIDLKEFCEHWKIFEILPPQNLFSIKENKLIQSFCCFHYLKWFWFWRRTIRLSNSLNSELYWVNFTFGYIAADLSIFTNGTVHTRNTYLATTKLMSTQNC